MTAQAKSKTTAPPTVTSLHGQQVPEHHSTARAATTKEEKIDHQMEDSFPASDPPSYSGGNHIIGAPVDRESEAAKPDMDAVKDAEKKVKSGDAAKPHTY